MDRNKKLARAMLKHLPTRGLRQTEFEPDVRSWGQSEEASALIESDPNALLIGALFNRGIRAEEAWEAPLALTARLGHFDVEKIARMTPSQLRRHIESRGKQKALHRRAEQVSKTVVLACRQLVSDYESDASRIWKDAESAGEVVARFESFHGVGQKIANMMVRLLVEYYGVVIPTLNELDIPVDRHVGRVFLRTGIVRGTRETTLSSIIDDIVEAARVLCPEYPAALDGPAFSIGKTWCTGEEAYCYDNEDEDGPCPLSAVCTKRRRSWQVVS
jgi:uncharacterized HhH-GPD family protein